MGLEVGPSVDLFAEEDDGRPPQVCLTIIELQVCVDSCINGTHVRNDSDEADEQQGDLVRLPLHITASWTSKSNVDSVSTRGLGTWAICALDC